MRNIIITAAALALPTLAGQPAAPCPAPQPAPVRHCADSPWSMEMGYNYNWGARDIMSWDGPCKEIRTHGADLTLVHHYRGPHAMTVRLGYNYGSRSWGGWDNEFEGSLTSNTVRTHTFTLMPGYRYTAALGERTSWFMGMNAGVANQSLKYRAYDSWGGEEYVGKLHDSAWGIAYSAELGLRYAVTPCMDLFVAYQFTGNAAMPTLRDDEGNSARMKAQNYHGIRAGVGFKF